MPSFDAINVRMLGTALVVIVLGGIISFFIMLYKRRHALDELPKPPYSFLWGNLPAIGELLATLPPRCHPHMMIHYLRTKHNLPRVFYIDTWPFGDSICAIVDPDVAYQVTVQQNFPKHEVVAGSIWPLTGMKNLVSMGGSEHKRWRTIFNPGFSNAHLMTLVGGIVDDSLTFTDILSKHAEKQDIFSLEEAATRLTVDIIGKVAMDMSMNTQTTENDFLIAFRNQLTWLLKDNEFNPLVLLNPMRRIVFAYNKWRMDKYISKVLDERFTNRSRAASDINGRRRPVIDLALDAYLKDNSNKSTAIDATFKTFAIDQIKTFMFAGHDTTSSTISYIAYALSKHPNAMSKTRAEYDEVFGSDLMETAQKIRDDPYLLNKLPYTTGVIKEILRLYPPASSVRKGGPGIFLHYDGKQYPTEGHLVWVVGHAFHRSPDYWPSANSFIPERWLAKEGDPLFPVKGAWRPFEFGPRQCIGIELAMIETKIIMALMLRQFDTHPAYEELDRLDGGNKLKSTPEGERAYQVRIATAKPVDGMPIRVTRRSIE